MWAHFFQNNKRNFDEAQCSYLFKVSSLKMLLFCSYFLWNICYLLTAKITSSVNNSLLNHVTIHIPLGYPIKLQKMTLTVFKSFFLSKLLKETYTIVILSILSILFYLILFIFLLAGLKIFLTCSNFLNNVNLVGLIKFVFIKIVNFAWKIENWTTFNLFRRNVPSMLPSIQKKPPKVFCKKRCP